MCNKEKTDITYESKNLTKKIHARVTNFFVKDLVEFNEEQWYLDLHMKIHGARSFLKVETTRNLIVSCIVLLDDYSTVVRKEHRCKIYCFDVRLSFSAHCLLFIFICLCF